MSSSSYSIVLGADTVNASVTVLPGQLKDVSNLKLVGRGAAGYGLAYAQNFAMLLCNFASATTEPSNPVLGQLWYNNTEKRLKVRTPSGWNSLYGEGTVLPVASGGTGMGTVGPASYILRVNTAGTALEYVPFNSLVDTSVVRTNASSVPTTDNAYSVGSSSYRFKEIYAVDFKGRADNAKRLETPRAISLTGDASWTVNFDGTSDVSGGLTLATVNSAPASNAFVKVTVNGKGLVTATSAVTSSDIITALGYTPVNKAGDTMTGSLITTGTNSLNAGTPGSTGYVRIIGVSSGDQHTGRIEFFGPNSIRHGFIGNSTTVGTTDTGTIEYIGGSHYFTGNLTSTGNIAAWGNVTGFSDLKLKTDIETIDNAIDKVKQIRGVTFIRQDINDNRRHTGVIAQEVQEVLPEAVFDDNGTLSVAYGNLVGLLIEAIKNQQTQIEELRNLIQKK